jgi:hypothetical protein
MPRNLAVMETRKVRRRRVFKAALIQLPGGAVSCVVRDLSETGALLQVPSQLGIPHEFSLRIRPAVSSRVALGQGHRDRFCVRQVSSVVNANLTFSHGPGASCGSCVSGEDESPISMMIPDMLAELGTA